LLRKILNKMKTQINVLVCITAFIWKVMLAIMYHIYSTVIRSVMTHKIIIWYTDSDMNRSEITCWDYKNELVKKLIKMQNKYLWVIIDVYKIMLTAVLETETHISLLNLYLNTRLVSFCQWHKKSDMKEIIKKTCKKI
jgi:hypothetical protein